MRFHNLQILRLVAAGGVVLMHLGTYAGLELGIGAGPDPWYRLRWFGSFMVPLFFAISGFVLTQSLQTSTPGRFLALRALRLYPAYWAAVALVVGSWHLGLWPGPYLPYTDPAPTLSAILVVPTRSVRLGQYPLMVEWTLIYEVILGFGLTGLWLALGRRRVAAGAAVWLLVIAVKCVGWPGYATKPVPAWNSVWLSAFVVPFLLGVLAYHLRDRGRRWRWAALAAVVGLNAAAGAWIPQHAEADIWLRGAASGLAVWALVNIRDARATNPLVIAGGYSYGLYLLHVPVILFTFRAMQRTDVLNQTVLGVVLTGVLAVTLGLAFGRLELAFYGRAKRATDRLSVRAVRGRLVGFGRRLRGRVSRSA